ncbi:MAG: hypothetical protein JXR70_04340 [Spirochaetales bacterium]|nr:hypothetical protein [Spirochaetales bacterium]
MEVSFTVRGIIGSRYFLVLKISWTAFGSIFQMIGAKWFCFMVFGNPRESIGKVSIMNPVIYEINAYLWFKNAKILYSISKISELPEKVFEEWRERGIDYLWFMGIWTNSARLVKDFCFAPELVEAYTKALPDWREEDVKASPFAVGEYRVHPFFGTMEDLAVFRDLCHKAGLKLILDFVPNHFSAYSPLVESRSGLFLQGDTEDLHHDSQTFFTLSDDKKIFAHGKDPYFSAWQDTIQVDYSRVENHDFMSELLLEIAQYCDGVRCDMAMLCLNEVFHNHWSRFLRKQVLHLPEEEFWGLAIKKVKKKFSDFIFIAEVYWNLEWELQQLGFDYTYDKELYDRLSFRRAHDIMGHLRADYDYQCRSLRFIENHDEKRALTQLGEKKSQAAFVIISTIQGMRFLHAGQETGRSVHIPVQLGREPVEEPHPRITAFYKKMEQVLLSPVIKLGQWTLLESHHSWEGNQDFFHILSWLWQYKRDRLLVCVNYSEELAQARIPLMLNYTGTIEMKDLLTDKVYYREAVKLQQPGLYVELGAYESHVLGFGLE